MLRIANCSGFYGDRFAAAREMVDGGPIDVLTGDYLAELTMAILYKKRLKNDAAGYASTFVRQVIEVIEQCMARGIKIVANAGGLDPEGCAQAVRHACDQLNVRPKIAWIEGDDLVPRLGELTEAGERLANIDSGKSIAESNRSVLTANAYLGAWGIKQALDDDADIVICPRVTDASIVIGPAAWKFGWSRDDYDQLAGALLAGHLIECGASVTGGNYAFFHEVPSLRNVGFPIAEIEADGSFTITKHPGTGGLVSKGTLTAQTLYEIGSPAYLNPDVTGHFDSFSMQAAGPERVRVTGVRGSSPPPTHKVCMNLEAGHRISIELALTGLDVEAKARVFTDALFDSLGGRETFDRVDELLLRTDRHDPQSNDAATATLRLIVHSSDPAKVGRGFGRKVTELALASFPGFYGKPAVTSSGPVIEHWPALVDSKHIVERVHSDGKVTEVLPTSQLDLPEDGYHGPPYDAPPVPNGPTARVPLGQLFGARSGDKGGNANVGVWARTEEAYAFLYHFLTAQKLAELLPDMAQYPIERFELPNILSLNFVIRGVLGEGIAAATRTDGQAKSLGEYLRARLIDVPEALL